MAKIDEFFEGGRFAVVEIDPATKYGGTVYEKLRGRGCEVIAILREPSPASERAGYAVYLSLADVPGLLDGVVFNVENQPQRILAEMKVAIAKGARRIWIENRCTADEAVQYAREHGAEVVDNACVLLALDPEHVHWLHRKMLDVFGKTPDVLASAATA